jgi:hypothetical protein
MEARLDRADWYRRETRAVIADPSEGPAFSAAVLPSDGTKLSGRNMPLVTWKVLLRRSDQVGYHYVTTLHRASEPTVAETIHLRVNGEPMHGTVIEVPKDFSTRAGVGAFTVMADENRADPA